MALEWRGTNQYFYKKKRVGDRVYSEYYGGGIVASLYDREEKKQRWNEQKKRIKEREVQEEYEQILAQIKDLEREIKPLIEAVMLASGYHLTKNRIWRQKRNDNTSSNRQK
jgi:N-methylhydantoinase B/oxoprolinase/acetone carboxylase alpha subunit